MNIDEKYMRRCLQLASYGRGYVSPNPMVGAVIVCDGKIIGEGYHRKYGEPHAEVNAVNSVKDKGLLKKSTMYVSLEPCSHYGKTPPCSLLIINCGIPRVVIATQDPFPQVAGGGFKMLKEAGVEIKIGILEKEARALNKDFFSRQERHRPYVYLKWAQTRDGFIDAKRTEGDGKLPTKISSNFTQMLVHKHRSEITSIMVGTNTAILDNPSLTTRLWYGKNPIRVVLDKTLKIPKQSRIFDSSASTLVFTEAVNSKKEIQNISYIPVCFDDNLLTNILMELNNYKIDSILVEGGSRLLNSFIEQRLWDEAFIEIANTDLKKGVKAPLLDAEIVSDIVQTGARLRCLKNNEIHNFL